LPTLVTVPANVRVALVILFAASVNPFVSIVKPVEYTLNVNPFAPVARYLNVF